MGHRRLVLKPFPTEAELGREHMKLIEVSAAEQVARLPVSPVVVRNARAYAAHVDPAPPPCNSIPAGIGRIRVCTIASDPHLGHRTITASASAPHTTHSQMTLLRLF